MSRNERGTVLIVTLVILVILMYAAVSVVRSTDTANQISGNFAFKQAALQASDRAIDDAMNNLANFAIDGKSNESVLNRYSAYQSAPEDLDFRGVPKALNWTGVACVDEKGVVVADCEGEKDKYRIQYFIERQCTNELGVVDFSNPKDILMKCSHDVRKDEVAESLTPKSIWILYRVIVRVRGPRGTEGFYEAVVSGPAQSS